MSGDDDEGEVIYATGVDLTPPRPRTPAGDMLRQAAALVEGSRRDSHGAPERSFEAIARYWTVYLSTRTAPPGAPIRAVDVARMMELLKIARGNKADDCLDAAGYAALALECTANATP